MIIRFDNFKLDVDKFELHCDNEVIHVEPRVFDLILMLTQNPRRILTRDEIIENVWGGRIISDATISTCVKSARKALGDSGEAQKYIKTIRGRGIQFLATPTTTNDDAVKKFNGKPNKKTFIKPSKLLTTSVLAGLVIVSLLLIILILILNKPMNTQTETVDASLNSAPYKIAVLSFADMSADRDQEYFGDGMAEEILNLLATTPGLDMTSRTSAFSLKGLNLSVPEISERLDVDYIVEGSVRTTGDRVRVTAQLVDVASDENIWSDTYDREMTSIFEVQDDISFAITDALKIELSANAANRTPPTSSIAAYDLYLRGHQLFLNRGTFGASERVGYLEEAITHLEQATTLDPNFALAWADLAGVSMVIPTFDGIKYSFEDMTIRSTIFIERALALSPNLSQAWAVRGFIYGVRLEFTKAEAAFKRATELNPQNETAWLWLGLNYTTVGASKLARESLEKAIEIAPVVAVNYNVLGAATHATGNAVLAAEYQNKVVVERGFELGRLDTFLLALDSNFDDPRGTRAAAIEDAKRYIDFLEKNTDPDRDAKLTLYVDAFLNPTLREQATRLLDEDIETRQKSSVIGAYVLGDGTRMARHFRLRTENDGLNLRRVFNPIGRMFFEHKDFRDFLISINMLDYWKTHQFPEFCRPFGENDFECQDVDGNWP